MSNNSVSPIQAHPQYGRETHQAYVEKEVVPGMTREVVPAGKEAVPTATYPYTVEVSSQPRPAAGDSTICGISKKAFYIIIAAFGIVLAISVGVGIGAGIAISHNMNRESTTAVPNASVAVTMSVFHPTRKILHIYILIKARY